EDDLLGERSAAPTAFLGPADARPTLLTEHALPRDPPFEELVLIPRTAAPHELGEFAVQSLVEKRPHFLTESLFLGRKTKIHSEAHLLCDHCAVEGRVAEERL